MGDKSKNQQMNILVSSDKKYLDYLMTMLFSLRKHNEEFTVYFLNKSISKKTIQKFIHQVKKEIDCNCIEIKIDETLCEQFPIYFKRISIETYLRLFAPFYLPQHMERILYLDVDIIVKKNLKDFYYQDFEGKSLVAIPESLHKSSIIKEHKEKVGLSAEHKYFNAGVLIMNLDKIRQTTSSDMILDLINRKKDCIEYQDQDVLNLLFEKDVKYESKYYNYQLIWRASVSEEDFEKIQILHYSGDEKPWKIKCIKEYSNAYWDIVKERGRVIRPALKLSMSKGYQAIRKCYYKIKG